MATCLIDGHYALHRTLHVPEVRLLRTKDNKPTGGVFAILRMVRSTLRQFPEIRRVVAVFDGKHSARRVELFPEYKTRDRNDEVDVDGLSYYQKFSMQINYLRFILPKMGIKFIQLKEREGDDTIGFLAKNSGDSLTIVMSDDRDMLQLVDEKIHVWRPMAEERVSLSNFEVFAGCKKEHWLLRKAILGDHTDAIPGVHGVGEKTLEKVFDELKGSVGPYPYENLFMYALDHDSKKIRSIGENFDLIMRNFELLDISRECITEEEISSALEEIRRESKFDVLTVKKMFEAFEFFSLVEDFPSWIVPFQTLI